MHGLSTMAEMNEAQAKRELSECTRKQRVKAFDFGEPTIELKVSEDTLEWICAALNHSNDPSTLEDCDIAFESIGKKLDKVLNKAAQELAKHAAKAEKGESK